MPASNVRQVTELIEELNAAGCDALGLTADPGTVPRLLAYARSVASFPTAVKEVCRLPCSERTRTTRSVPSLRVPARSLMLSLCPCVLLCYSAFEEPSLLSAHRGTVSSKEH